METQNDLINTGNNTQGEDMKIKIQTFDNIYPITIKRTSLVNELKDKIAQVFIC